MCKITWNTRVKAFVLDELSGVVCSDLVTVIVLGSDHSNTFSVKENALTSSEVGYLYILCHDLICFYLMCVLLESLLRLFLLQLKKQNKCENTFSSWGWKFILNLFVTTVDRTISPQGLLVAFLDIYHITQSSSAFLIHVGIKVEFEKSFLILESYETTNTL